MLQPPQPPAHHTILLSSSCPNTVYSTVTRHSNPWAANFYQNGDILYYSTHTTQGPHDIYTLHYAHSLVP